MTEIESLQNAADDLGLIIMQQQGKKKYFAVKLGVVISPTLNYDKLNHFLLGYRAAFLK